MTDADQAQYWKTIVETMADGLMIVNRTGMIVSINHAMEKLTGYSALDLVGRNCRILKCDTCKGERAGGGKDAHCALFREGRIRRSRCVMRKKDGTPINVLKNASVLRSSDGEVTGGVETLSDLSETVANENEISSLRQELNNRDSFHGIIGVSNPMQQIFGLISSVARSDAPVIVYGESGVGKELVAQAIHNSGARKDGPFIKVNCAALNESLLESELFGHVKGAFTGADRNRVGRFEAASGGNIFLDEIGEIPPSIQVKLLRVLQEKEIERVGCNKTVPIDVRIISATNKDLKTMTESGQFREDLYYRIGVIPIHIPPLRKRREDIPPLINAFVNHVALKTGKPISGLSNEAFERLESYHWPGNVRELINVIEYAFVLCPGGVIGAEHLPRTLFEHESTTPVQFAGPAPGRQDNDPETEKKRIVDALNRSDGNKSQAARMLGISRVSLYKKLKKYDVRVDKQVAG